MRTWWWSSNWTRFKRVYVEREHGLPFLQGSHLVHFDPADIKYVSLKAHERRMDSLLIRAHWVLITRSGTIGRVAVAPRQWDGWAASEHIMRIVPRDRDETAPPGYLAAFLRSFPGQAQLTSSIYGAVVDEITEEQTRAVLVPVAKTAAQRRAVQQIDATVMEAVRRQGEAVKLVGESQEAVTRLIGG